MKKRVATLIKLGPGPVLPPPPREKVFLTLEEAATRLGVSKPTLKQWIAAGTIYAIPVGMTRMKVPVGEIEKWKDGRYAPNR